MPRPLSLLDPVLVSRMATLELRARAVAEGLLAGRHRGRRRGRALEFSGHRPYTASDDWRRISQRPGIRLSHCPAPGQRSVRTTTSTTAG